MREPEQKSTSNFGPLFVMSWRWMRIGVRHSGSPILPSTDWPFMYRTLSLSSVSRVLHGPRPNYGTFRECDLERIEETATCAISIRLSFLTIRALAITLTSREHSSVLPASLQARTESKQVKRIQARFGSWRSNKRTPTSLNAFFMRSTAAREDKSSASA